MSSHKISMSMGVVPVLLRFAVAVAAVIIFIGAVVGAGVWLADRRTETPPAGQAFPAVSEEASPSPTACDPAPFRPTYLPWLQEGEPIPPPDDEIREQRDTILVWYRDPEQRWKDVHVYLATLLGPPYRDPEFPTVNVRGNRATLVWVGDPGVGILSLDWRERQGHCGSFSLALLTKGFSQQEAEAEIRRIARSLVDN